MAIGRHGDSGQKKKGEKKKVNKKLRTPFTPFRNPVTLVTLGFGNWRRPPVNRSLIFGCLPRTLAKQGTGRAAGGAVFSCAGVLTSDVDVDESNVR